MSAQDFSDEQKRYLEGFVSGVQASRAAAGLKPLAGAGGCDAAPSGPDAPHLAAMAAQEAAGGKLANEEKAKRDEHPFDAYPRLKGDALAGRFPKGVDNFRWRFHGLYYVAPTQDAFMCRMRIPGGILKAWQLAEIANLADRHGGGYAHVTTRANLQIREIPAAEGPPLIEALADIGVNPKGSGADNIRNVTGSATAGIDPQELIDTQPFAKAWHHHILNTRVLYGLPRKFNVSFDGGGRIPTLEETNDIAFTAVKVANDIPASADEPGLRAGEVLFQLALGGIAGHRDFARATGVYVTPEETTEVADAIVRIFIANGIRTDRKKARLKYVLDDWGFDRFLSEVETLLDRRLRRLPHDAVLPPPPRDRHAHIGVHPQKQEGRVWVGVALMVGRLSTDQMRAIADIARTFGDGDIRLTVWQNLLISGVAAENAPAVAQAVRAVGLNTAANSVRAGLVACTGNTGCKFAASDTKGTARQIAEYLDERIVLDQPVNIHLTGCHHSCAQHYIGDIGLIACRVPVDPDGEETVEGFHVLVGGGFASDADIARELFENVTVADCPELVGRILRAYLDHRTDADEPFHAFARRHDDDALRDMIERTAPRDSAAEPRRIAP